MSDRIKIIIIFPTRIDLISLDETSKPIILHHFISPFYKKLPSYCHVQYQLK